MLLLRSFPRKTSSRLRSQAELAVCAFFIRIAKEMLILWVHNPTCASAPQPAILLHRLRDQSAEPNAVRRPARPAAAPAASTRVCRCHAARQWPTRRQTLHGRLFHAPRRRGRGQVPTRRSPFFAFPCKGQRHRRARQGLHHRRRPLPRTPSNGPRTPRAPSLRPLCRCNPRRARRRTIHAARLPEWLLPNPTARPSADWQHWRLNPNTAASSPQRRVQPSHRHRWLPQPRPLSAMPRRRRREAQRHNRVPKLFCRRGVQGRAGEPTSLQAPNQRPKYFHLSSCGHRRLVKRFAAPAGQHVRE
mmetsp:Transcript_60343/g.173135  ORF Transcript_60343/g.173135 Transcript_60343/m.173135 type:complete len:303 (+) Transcript_60343:397-1305(+)